uniref:Uncharacterized protein MANES_06G083600 n=1 Tax=Rhizophora mucronata TaxID=61149 RepID=A0A2P2KQX8_RHIMU
MVILLHKGIANNFSTRTRGRSCFLIVV